MPALSDSGDGSGSDDDEKGGPKDMKGPRVVANAQHDEELELSASMESFDPKDAPTVSRAAGGKQQGGVVNKPYDEAVDLSDESDGSQESDVDTEDERALAAAGGGKPAGDAGKAADKKGSAPVPQPTPAAKQPAMGSGLGTMDTPAPVNAHGGGGAPSAAAAAAPRMKSSGGDDDESESESEGSDDEEAEGTQVEGLYNAKDYQHLNVTAEVKDLFQYIGRYKAHEVELESAFKPFVPDYVPAVGVMDAFVKVLRPDGERDELGLKVLDEPAASQSDATVLELQLRAVSKKQHGDVAVRAIEQAAKNAPEIERWIESIADLHRSRPPPEVVYKKPMPDIETLMQEWPEKFEAMLGEVQLPGVETELSLEEYARVVCAIMDVPIYDGNYVEALHVLFTLYMEFKENVHFNAVDAGGPAGAGGGDPQNQMNQMMGGGAAPMV